ncbi:MAG TPA: hypothetical protein VJB70_04840 [Candidatus Paceibacterota bacterium]
MLDNSVFGPFSTALPVYVAIFCLFFMAILGTLYAAMKEKAFLAGAAIAFFVLSAGLMILWFVVPIPEKQGGYMLGALVFFLFSNLALAIPSLVTLVRHKPESETPASQVEPSAPTSRDVLIDSRERV